MRCLPKADEHRKAGRRLLSRWLRSPVEEDDQVKAQHGARMRATRTASNHPGHHTSSPTAFSAQSAAGAAPRTHPADKHPTQTDHRNQRAGNRRHTRTRAPTVGRPPQPSTHSDHTKPGKTKTPAPCTGQANTTDKKRPKCRRCTPASIGRSQQSRQQITHKPGEMKPRKARRITPRPQGRGGAS